jgi:uncharacterized Zn finger protein
MFRIKKCANCGQNSFKLLVDVNPSLCCENCGQIYAHTVFKRLPDDIEASKNIKVSIVNNLTEIPNGRTLITG